MARVERSTQVWETSTFIGTGDVTGLTAEVKSFLVAYGTGGSNRFKYFVRNRAVPGEYEEGLGHLSDGTTLVRDTVIRSSNSGSLVNFSAGVKDITSDFGEEAIEVAESREVTGASATLELADRGGVIYMNSGSAQALTIPANGTVALDVDSVIHVIREGAGAVTIEAASGVTLNGISEGAGSIQTRYQGVSLIKRAANTWIASGDIGTVA